jgi:hypothetical protein
VIEETAMYTNMLIPTDGSELAGARPYSPQAPRATSGRSCSAARRLFFEADAMANEQPPGCTAAAGDPSLAHRRDDLIQRQIRLLGNQRQQTVRVLFQRRI